MKQLSSSNTFMLLLFLIAATFIHISNAQTTYNYDNSGTDWPGLCQTGQNQSPINIQNVQGNCDSSMIINLQLSDLTINTNITLTNGSLYSAGQFSYLYATDVNGNLYGYNAQYMEMHVPSEHQIDGQQFAAELQIMHKLKSEFLQYDPPQDTMAGVSIFFEVGSTSSANSSFFSSWNPANLNQQFQINMVQALSGNFDPTQTYYTYQGSLTYPNCAEIVNWYVYPTPIQMTTAQLNTLTSYFSGDLNFANGNGDNRALQNLNGRTIKQGNVECPEQFIYFFTFFIIYVFLNFFVFKML